MQPEFNFIEPSVTEVDRVLFLGPFNDADGPFIDIQPGWSMAHVMHASGVFPSVKQAKQNDWDKPIPIGYDESTVGKRKLRVITLTKLD